MKKDIHPAYREVAFVDLSNDFKFITRSTVSAREKITIDGKEYPLVKIEVSSESHPFYTGKHKSSTRPAASRSSARSSAIGPARPLPDGRPCESRGARSAGSRFRTQGSCGCLFSCAAPGRMSAAHAMGGAPPP